MSCKQQWENNLSCLHLLLSSYLDFFEGFGRASSRLDESQAEGTLLIAELLVSKVS
jgi:hypothetical protein